jgi:hypothetical protein
MELRSVDEKDSMIIFQPANLTKTIGGDETEIEIVSASPSLFSLISKLIVEQEDGIQLTAEEVLNCANKVGWLGTPNKHFHDLVAEINELLKEKQKCASLNVKIG